MNNTKSATLSFPEWLNNTAIDAEHSGTRIYFESNLIPRIAIFRLSPSRSTAHRPISRRREYNLYFLPHHLPGPTTGNAVFNENERPFSSLSQREWCLKLIRGISWGMATSDLREISQFTPLFFNSPTNKLLVMYNNFYLLYSSPENSFKCHHRGKLINYIYTPPSIFGLQHRHRIMICARRAFNNPLFLINI